MRRQDRKEKAEVGQLLQRLSRPDQGEESTATGTIKGRFFLVGCPRSGTTLLQSLIAAHPAVVSFPETHFLVATGNTRRGRWCTRLGLASPETRDQLNRFLTEMGENELRSLLPRQGLFIGQYAAALVRILDTLALKQGAAFWLEKTPGHLHYVDLLERHIPNARFIHILREGADVVASLFEVTHKHPHDWGGAYDIEKCIARWNSDAGLTQYYCRKANHLLVRYEQLLEDPEAVLADVCRFIGIPFVQAMIAQHEYAAESITLKRETWKQAVKQDIHKAGGSRFERVFDEEQRSHILERLVSIDDN